MNDSETALAMRIVLATAVLSLAATVALADSRPLETGAFAVEHALTLPGTPEEIYDAITGDLTGWWDHSFSGKPLRFELDPRPGGEFREIFDESGDGVRHAVVTFARRGETLRFEGPLGLTGNALLMVHTYRFAAVGEDSTRLTLTVHGSGELQESWVTAVDATWHHFLFERFKPYVEGGMRPLD